MTTYVPCKHGHTFIYSASNTYTQCPPGIVCECGKTMTRRVRCPTCGQGYITTDPFFIDRNDQERDDDYEVTP